MIVKAEGRFRAVCDRCGLGHSRAYLKQEWAVQDARQQGWSVHPSGTLCPVCRPDEPDDMEDAA